jgi:hypothetical protein
MVPDKVKKTVSPCVVVSHVMGMVISSVPACLPWGQKGRRNMAKKSREKNQVGELSRNSINETQTLLFVKSYLFRFGSPWGSICNSPRIRGKGEKNKLIASRLNRYC